MNIKSTASLVVASWCICTTLSAHGQVYKLHQADVAVGGTGQFTTSTTSQDNVPHQATTDSAGFLLTLRDHPLSFAGVEFNYGYTKFHERFTSLQSAPLANLPASVHEATGAYLFHRNYKRFQPFVGVGGGALFFNPQQGTLSQTRGVGLFEVGAEVPTSNPHLGFRVQARSLNYRAPNYNQPAISSSRWVSTNEPSASVFFRF